MSGRWAATQIPSLYKGYAERRLPLTWYHALDDTVSGIFNLFHDIKSAKPDFSASLRPLTQATTGS